MKKSILFIVLSFILTSCSHNSIVVNPDNKAKYLGDPKLYDYIVRGLKGCDGIVKIEFVVEKDGSLSNFKCLSVVGKTNCKVGIRQLQKLKEWRPATIKRRKVRSLLTFNIHT